MYVYHPFLTLPIHSMGSVLDLTPFRKKEKKSRKAEICHIRFFIYPISHIPYPISQIPYPISNIPYPISHIPNPKSHIPYPISHIPYSISHIPYPISHIPYTHAFLLITASQQCFPLISLVKSYVYVRFAKSTLLVKL